jgi:hypothetical protein
MSLVKNNRLYHSLLLVTTILVYMAALSGDAFALVLPRDLINNVSPSANVTTTNGPLENDNWHNMVLSDHGKVPKVVVGMYFTTKTDKTFKINVNTARACNINGLGASFPGTSNFVYIKVEGQNKIGIPGNKICSTGAGNLDDMSFRINADSLTNATNDTAMHKATVTIEWVNGTDEGAYPGIRGDLSKKDSGYGSRFWFRFKTSEPESRVGYVNTDRSTLGEPNNSLIFSKQTDNQDGPKAYADMYFPFGPSCLAATSTDRAVTLYDADNGTASQNPPLGFYVGTVDSTGTITPLRAEEYVGSNGDKDDITVKEVPSDNNRVANDGSSLGDLRQGGPNRPIFYPSNFHNEGGSTTVKIKTFKKKTHYVLVAVGVHQGQFIYVGLPGDAIFGSPDFDYNDPKYCKETNGVNISPRVEINSEYEPGDRVTVTAFVGNSSEPLQPASSKYHRIFWYERNGGDTFENGVDGTIQDRPPGAGPGRITWSLEETEIEAGNPNWSTVIPPNTTEGRICTSLELLDPDSNTTIDPPSQTKCANIIKKPYLSVLNGDVNTTKDHVDITPCTTGPNKISAFYDAPQGSGTQIAAFAGSTVNQFVSAALRSTIPMREKGLTFANTSGTYGGPFGTYIGCSKDADWTAPNNISPGPNTLSGNATGTKIYDGKLLITDDVNLPNNFDLATKPFLKVVVRGDIYIQSNVRQLDGIYMATGTIYTCTNGSSQPVSIDSLRSICDNRLTVTGSLIANDIKFLRLAGSLKDSSPAESFIYDPLNWLPVPRVGGGTAEYDSYMIMPPIL